MLLYSILVFFLACGLSSASEGSGKGDKCSDFDTCKAGSLFRTCSCDDDCYKTGTCCSDAKSFPLMGPEQRLYGCRSDQAVTPVFAKIKCSKSYEGHDVYRTLCEDAANDPADVLGTVLFTGSKSKKTYWNKNCAICNKEDEGDLKQWTVQVACPSKHGQVTFNKRTVERNLTFDRDSGEWGLFVHDGFLACSVHFVQPSSMVGKLNYCAPNIVSVCPEGTKDEELVKNCMMYHAERRRKSSGQYFRNVHCAQCNGVAEEDLECVGRRYGPLSVGKSDDIVKVTFDTGMWLDREGEEKFVCSVGNSWDPYSKACRKTPEGSVVVKIASSAPAMTVPFSALVLVQLVLVFKFLFF